jgi:UDP-3-O-[3-hydroxymyristoyl] glucosamine N-acyltransferase
MDEYNLSEVALLIDAELVGDPGIKVSNIAKIEEAVSGDLSFIANPKYLKYADTTNASALIVSKAFTTARTDIALLKVDDPYFSFLTIMERIETPKNLTPLKGIHPTAVIDESVKLGKDVYIGPHVVICGKCEIGNNTVIHAGCYIGENSVIGNSTLIYPNVVIRDKSKIGNKVIIHPGVVIGADGFGFVPTKDGKYVKLPQLGGVVIEDNVEIGANTTIDRATIGNTIIHSGTKIDNLVMVAHNVVVGDNTVLVAQTGISGSTKIGKNCVIAGQVGLVGHIEIADKVTIGAQSGISKSIKKEGSMYFGSPATEYHVALRNESAVRQLPEMLKEFRELKQKILDLEKQISEKK